MRPLRRPRFATAVTQNLTSAYAALCAFDRAAGRLDLHAAAVAVTSVGAHRYHVGYDAAKAGVESVVRESHPAASDTRCLQWIGPWRCGTACPPLAAAVPVTLSNGSERWAYP